MLFSNLDLAFTHPGDADSALSPVLFGTFGSYSRAMHLPCLQVYQSTVTFVQCITFPMSGQTTYLPNERDYASYISSKEKLRESRELATDW